MAVSNKKTKTLVTYVRLESVLSNMDRCENSYTIKRMPLFKAAPSWQHDSKIESCVAYKVLQVTKTMVGCSSEKSIQITWVKRADLLKHFNVLIVEKNQQIQPLLKNEILWTQPVRIEKNEFIYETSFREMEDNEQTSFDLKHVLKNLCSRFC